MIKLDASQVAQLKKELIDAQKELEQESGKVAHRVGRVGTQEAIRQAPVYSGETVRRIKGFPNGDDEFIIMSEDSTPEQAGFNLPVWLATSNEALSYIKSGDPRYMDRAGEEVADKVDREITIAIIEAFN